MGGARRGLAETKLHARPALKPTPPRAKMGAVRCRLGTLACTSIALAACGGPTPRLPGEEPELERRLARDPGELVGIDLLPLRPRRVFWYRAHWKPPAGDPVDREVALFTAPDREAGTYLESLGLPARLRFVVKRRRLYLTAGDLDAAGYRVVLHGSRSRLRERNTALGSLPCLLVELEEAGLRARHWFSPGVGLVAYELSLVGAKELALSLELLEELPRGPPPTGYDCRSPETFWKSYQEAVRRLDVGGLERLLAPELLRKLPWPGDPSLLDPELPRALREDDPDLLELARVRAWMPDLLDVRLEPTGPWKVAERAGAQVATAPGRIAAWLEDGEHRGPATIELRWGDDGWQLAGFSSPLSARRER
ncbi:MAG: hypothetical protein D6731_08635 [Planctomycetota bacterium]|nr:MAG: hypothetical protein D6731_08635 [Planctomycetota bacterium]